MYVARIGFTPVKGARHRTHESVRLAPGGPEGDRVFCLVDPATDRCLRTVENPALLRTAATWDGTVLSVDLPAGATAGEPEPTGETWAVDYWGRTVRVQPVRGPWAAAYSAHLGRDVVLATAAPGQVVYGASVTLVTGASLAALADEQADEPGAAVDDARFRATFRLDGDDLQPFEEDGWAGRRLLIGAAELRVRGPVTRCAVVDLDPATGVRDAALLKALARRGHGAVTFGVEADVVVPATVRAGDLAVVV